MKQITQDTADLVKMLDNLRKVDFMVDRRHSFGKSIAMGMSYIFLKDFCNTTKLSLNDIASDMCEEICEASKKIKKKYEKKLSNMIFEELDKQYNRQQED